MPKMNKPILSGAICLMCFFGLSQKSFAIEASELADICKATENAISDISLEYEWDNVPPMTIDDINGTGNFITKGPRKQSIKAKKPFDEYITISETATYMNAQEQCFETIDMKSYNGQNIKHLQDGGLTSDGKAVKGRFNATISKNKSSLPSVNLTPLGFSAFRLSYDVDRVLLSERLRHTDLVHIDNSLTRINDFNAIRADLLTQWNKQVCIKVYFSVDHSYTPIRYEFLNGLNLAYTVNVTSLEKVANGLWFPRSGFIKSTQHERADTYRATSKIIVNQDLKDDIFDLQFPSGTKVTDEITGKQYTIKPTQEQVDNSLPAK